MGQGAMRRVCAPKKNGDVEDTGIRLTRRLTPGPVRYTRTHLLLRAMRLKSSGATNAAAHNRAAAEPLHSIAGFRTPEATARRARRESTPPSVRGSDAPSRYRRQR